MRVCSVCIAFCVSKYAFLIYVCLLMNLPFGLLVYLFMCVSVSLNNSKNMCNLYEKVLKKQFLKLECVFY